MRGVFVGVVVVAAGCATRVDRAHEVARVRAHLERVERELVASTPDTLTPAQAEKRAEVIRNLHRYLEAEQFPTNDVSAEPTPIFVDAYGARCAMAALLETSGHGALVERIAREQDRAYIEELKDDPELKAWLKENGVTLAEAAWIQPSYANTVAGTWLPTASVFGSAQAGGDTQAGAQGLLGLGVRVGARRVQASNSSCDHCVYASTAFVADYVHAWISGVGNNDALALLVQYELNQQAYDHQYYVLAGPAASYDEGSAPGFRFGGKVGVGFSLRRRSVPIFAELVLEPLARVDSVRVLGGLVFGLVW